MCFGPNGVFFDNPLSALPVRFRGVFMQWLRISAPLLVAKFLRNIITDTFYPRISSQGYNYYTTFRDPTVRIINNGSRILWLVPIHELSVKISSILKTYTCNCLYCGIWYMKIGFECILNGFGHRIFWVVVVFFLSTSQLAANDEIKRKMKQQKW